MCRPSYLHLALLLALVSSTITSTHAKTSHLRQIAATVTKDKRALLSIKQQQNEQPVVASNNEVDASSETTPTVGLPYTEKVEKEDSDRHSTLQDRHGPTLPDRVPHDVDSTTITFKPTGGGGPDPAATVDPSLGLPFLVVIGGGTLFVLTAVIVAAKKMRNNEDDEDEEDEDEDNADGDIEAADAAKDHGAMDFSSIVPGNDVEEEAS